MCRDFTAEVIVPRAEEIERTGEYPYDIMSRMAELGMMGIPIPDVYGGSGSDWVGMHLCIEEISRGDLTLGALLDVTTSVVAQELYVFGTEAQRKEWLVPIANESLSYAKERVQFGKAIAGFQAIQFKLADMAVAIELARNQYLKAAWLKDQGREHAFEATAARLFASEMLERTASDAVQIHGGYGYMAEYPVSRYYKAAKVLQIVEGTSEVMRIILSRGLGLRDGYE